MMFKSFFEKDSFEYFTLKQEPNGHFVRALRYMEIGLMYLIELV